ncbi:MAG: NADH:ubiquinone reductase (Na(+)-transporting) subunit B [Candidatus Hydrogenedens sp.]|nr:NADH:ubiquinone reductase (Na(+)-transporting) subunit B [Candidatus Hydrogenedentota bacterium]NLF58521.1 NADH:ubiquinone reductase (Na(+)-transporting) subunit B [Candidatus Hydrogenedens sp.]
MKFLRTLMDIPKPLFEKGGKLEKAYPLYEAIDTFLFTPGRVTSGGAHVRDAVDLKRLMFSVVICLSPVLVMALWNTGYQANAVLHAAGQSAEGWRGAVLNALGVGYDPSSALACMLHGALWFLPVLIVTFSVGGTIEVIVASIRGHEVHEGFFVTGFLIPLILPPTIPLWQVGVATAFGVLVGKEAFGGTGMNIFNPALVTRAFLYFAYPAESSGDKVWIAANPGIDGFSGATALARIKEIVPGVDGIGHTDAVAGMVVNGHPATWWDCFLGWVPGSMGETSVLACLIGAVILLVMQVTSWKIMLSMIAGTFAASAGFNLMGSATNEMVNLPFHWHLVVGGYAFGLVYMATEPVTATHSETGKYIYGFMIGLLVVLIRVVNPAYPEGVMLAILFMNLMAPLIDHFVVAQNIRRRALRSAI